MGISDPRLSFLESFFFFFPDTGRLSFLVAVANVHSHGLGSWVLSPPGSLLDCCL